jgi:pyrroloquinoline quinone (PQQ) biosynthesis protein C
MTSLVAPADAGFHARLLAATHGARQELLSLPILREAVEGRVTREDYVAFLTQAWHHVRHTTPLLMACGARLPARLEWLRTAVAEYIKEEVGHQDWILDDLAALGADRTAIAASAPAPATELMVSYAYDTIARRNPVGFFGMVLVLEGTSVAIATRAAEVIERTLSLPRSAFSYLRSHGDLDVEHTGFYAELMDRLDDPADQAAVVHAARMFYRLYADVFATLRAPAALAVAA